ncbi:MAG: hypothetical protein P1U40_06120 [Coxiellaceae bacterium]|nr:hypothetical protein [Coxiellaceae bacterium]
MSRGLPVAAKNLLIPGLEEYSHDIWRFHVYPGDVFSVDDVPVSGEHYKLRANFPADVFRENKTRILRWIFQHGMRAEFEARGHDVVKAVKHVLVEFFDDTDDRRYRDTGQLTLFLQPDAPLEKVKAFALRFQAYINELVGVTPHVPMENDFRLKACPNLSMRLNDIDGVYQSSILISECKRVKVACGLMVQDSNTFAMLAEEGSGIVRETDDDVIHQMLRLGYEKIVFAEQMEPSDVDKQPRMVFGQACQQLALLCRKIANNSVTPKDLLDNERLDGCLQGIIDNELEYAEELEEVYAGLPEFELLVLLRSYEQGTTKFVLTMAPDCIKNLSERLVQAAEERQWSPSAVSLYMERVSLMIDCIPDRKAAAFLALEFYRVKLLAQQKTARLSTVASTPMGVISQALAAIDLLQVCIEKQSTALLPAGEILDAGLNVLIAKHDLLNKDACVYLAGAVCAEEASVVRSHTPC